MEIILLMCNEAIFTLFTLFTLSVMYTLHV